MDKVKQFIGIDISKDSFDVWIEALGHSTYTNNTKGFKKFSKLLTSDSYCVMEATGSYYQQLAGYLYLSSPDIGLQ